MCAHFCAPIHTLSHTHSLAVFPTVCDRQRKRVAAHVTNVACGNFEWRASMMFAVCKDLPAPNPPCRLMTRCWVLINEKSLSFTPLHDGAMP